MRMAYILLQHSLILLYFGPVRSLCPYTRIFLLYFCLLISYSVEMKKVLLRVLLSSNISLWMLNVIEVTMFYVHFVCSFYQSLLNYSNSVSFTKLLLSEDINFIWNSALKSIKKGRLPRP